MLYKNYLLLIFSDLTVYFIPLPGSQKTGHKEERGDEDPTGPQISAKRASVKSLQSQSSTEDNSWAAADSPVSTRRTAVRVSFKGDKELSEVHDIVSDFKFPPVTRSSICIVYLKSHLYAYTLRPKPHSALHLQEN